MSESSKKIEYRAIAYTVTETLWIYFALLGGKETRVVEGLKLDIQQGRERESSRKRNSYGQVDKNVRRRRRGTRPPTAGLANLRHFRASLHLFPRSPQDA